MCLGPEPPGADATALGPVFLYLMETNHRSEGFRTLVKLRPTLSLKENELLTLSTARTNRNGTVSLGGRGLNPIPKAHCQPYIHPFTVTVLLWLDTSLPCLLRDNRSDSKRLSDWVTHHVAAGARLLSKPLAAGTAVLTPWAACTVPPMAHPLPWPWSRTYRTSHPRGMTRQRNFQSWL